MLLIMDIYFGGWSILFIVIFECIFVGWVYGKDFFFKSINLIGINKFFL